MLAEVACRAKAEAVVAMARAEAARRAEATRVEAACRARADAAAASTRAEVKTFIQNPGPSSPVPVVEISIYRSN